MHMVYTSQQLDKNGMEGTHVIQPEAKELLRTLPAMEIPPTEGCSRVQFHIDGLNANILNARPRFTIANLPLLTMVSHRSY